MIKVGIIGCGVIGGVMKDWIQSHNKDCILSISDPAKNYNDDLSSVDVAFVSIHIPTQEDGTQDLVVLKSIIKSLRNIPIFIRTTLLPGTCDFLSKEFGKEIYFMPEFLTERTAYDDFCVQPMIFTGHIELLKSIFRNKTFIQMSNIEAEITKYSHNVFGAVKVTYFNCIYELSKKLGCDYEKIRNGILLSGYIGKTHTMVPGPDGLLGYGGKCFPKDISAFAEFNSNSDLGKLLRLVIDINNSIRNL